MEYNISRGRYPFNILLTSVTPKHCVAALSLREVRSISNDCLIDYLLFLRPARDFFTYMEMSPLPVKGSEIKSVHDAHGP
jgi:hypothetical protein